MYIYHLRAFLMCLITTEISDLIYLTYLTKYLSYVPTDESWVYY